MLRTTLGVALTLREIGFFNKHEKEKASYYAMVEIAAGRPNVYIEIEVGSREQVLGYWVGSYEITDRVTHAA